VAPPRNRIALRFLGVFLQHAGDAGAQVLAGDNLLCLLACSILVALITVAAHELLTRRSARCAGKETSTHE
jgi:hypothetical protein